MGEKNWPIDIDEVVFSRIENAATRAAALLSGQLDMVYNVPPQDIERIRNTPGMKIWQTPELRTIFLGMDQARDELLESNLKGKNPFKDKRVRQAFLPGDRRGRDQDKGHARLRPSDGADGRARHKRF